MSIPIDLSRYSPTLFRQPEGFWSTGEPTNHLDLSYPDAGNAACFEIEDKSFWFRHRNKAISEMVRQFPPTGPVFDVGGGNGFVAAGLSQAGWDVVVVEPGRAGALNALQRGLPNIVCSNLEAAEFRPGSLPAVGLFDVLEHVAQEQPFLSQIRGLLQPGGRLYVSVPSHWWLWSQADVEAEHCRRYSCRSLRRSLEAAGLRVEFLSYMFWALPLPILMLRTLPYCLGRRRSAIQQASAEHGVNSSWTSRLADAVFGFETRLIRGKWPVPCGASCLAVASAAP